MDEHKNLVTRILSEILINYYNSRTLLILVIISIFIPFSYYTLFKISINSQHIPLDSLNVRFPWLSFVFSVLYCFKRHDEKKNNKISFYMTHSSYCTVYFSKEQDLTNVTALIKVVNNSKERMKLTKAIIIVPKVDRDLITHKMLLTQDTNTKDSGDYYVEPLTDTEITIIIQIKENIVEQVKKKGLLLKFVDNLAKESKFEISKSDITFPKE